MSEDRGSGEPDNKEIVFDSKDIGKKEKPEYFVKVEGAEERKKEAIRRIKAQKADIIKEEKAQKRATEKEKKRQIKATNRANRQRRRKAFVKKYKIIFILLGLLLAGALIAGIVFFIQHPPLTKTERESYDSMILQGEIDTEFAEKSDEILNEQKGSYDDVVAWAKSEIDKTDDDARKFQLYSHLVNLASSSEETLDDSFIYLKEMEGLAKTDDDYVTLYTYYSLAYFEKGDMSKYEEYSAKSMEYRKRIERLIDGAV